MRTLVTGGAGFIGTHLVQRLVELGEDVIVLDNMETQVHQGRPPVLPDGVAFLQGDVGDAELVDVALDGVDRVVHLAAAVGVGQSMYEIADYVRKNTYATSIFLERMIARPTRPSRLVVASSMSIYGEGEYGCALHGTFAPSPRADAQLADRTWECLCPECGDPLVPRATREAKPLIPTSVYAITKRDHEELALVVGAAYGIPTTALRFFNVYGPGQSLSNPYTGVAAIFSSRLLNGRPPVIFEDGQQTRDLIHVSDIVEGLLLALGSDVAVGRAINLGTGRRTSVLDVAGALASGLGVSVEPEINGQYRAGDIRHCYADTQLAEELLGFRADVSLERGMRELISWLADQEADDRVAAATGELAAWGLTR